MEGGARNVSQCIVCIAGVMNWHPACRLIDQLTWRTSSLLSLVHIDNCSPRQDLWLNSTELGVLGLHWYCYFCFPLKMTQLKGRPIIWIMNFIIHRKLKIKIGLASTEQQLLPRKCLRSPYTMSLWIYENFFIKCAMTVEIATFRKC